MLSPAIPVDSLKSEAKDMSVLNVWLNGKQYWEKFLWRLHISKNSPDEAELNTCYRMLLEDCGALTPLEAREAFELKFSSLSVALGLSGKSTIDKIQNIRDVNALADDCTIEFGKNLTIVYGDNGSGKSGIGRLLSNACRSRQPRTVLPNAHKAISSSTKAKADFHVTDPSGSRIINYSLGETHDLLKSFSVFDHECAPVHLNNENKIEFTPSQIKIFDDVFKSIGQLEDKLKEESAVRTRDNPLQGAFTENSSISTFINLISHATTDKQIIETLTFTDTDAKLLETKKIEIAEKQKLDISKQKKELVDQCVDLDTLKDSLSKKGSILSSIRAEEINIVVKEIKDKKELAEKLGLNNFEFKAFRTIGSPEWKSLIIAAEKLYEKETQVNGNKDLDYCLLCRQSIAEPEKALFMKYWEFLKSTAEKELASARQSLKTASTGLTSELNSWPNFSETESAIKILKVDFPKELLGIQTIFSTLKSEVEEWIKKMGREEIVKFNDVQIDTKWIEGVILKKKEIETKLVDPAPEIKALNEQIVCLNHKQQAFNLLPKVREYASWLRWQNAVSSSGLSKAKSSITRKRTEFMDELVISKYIGLFNEETKLLDCNFGLKAKSRGRSGETVKGLKLEFATGHNPSDILSEGEQTVSSLADFLTEINLQDDNSGIVFDDPVTSLDHLRKPVIAERLVKESKKRQVVVLTHDIMFLNDLQFYAERDSIDCIVSSMRKIGSQSGVIKKELPWVAQNVKDRVGYLRNQLVSLKKLENGDQDEYRIKVKGWYGLLYEGWERAIEERLFKGTVQRFSSKIHPQKITRLVISDDFKKEINDAMTEAAKWRHDQPVASNSSVPKETKLLTDLELLASFISKCEA